jgi:hypothetical protein
LKYVLDDLEPRAIREALRSVPSNLELAYIEVFQRIEKNKCRGVVLKILSWIYHARRIMTMAEVCEAIVVGHGDTEFNSEDIVQPARIVAWCQGLVSYDEASGRTELSHYTVHEFLETNPEIAPLFSDLVLSKACLKYMILVPCEELLTRPFMHYAGCFWSDHARGENEMDPEVQSYTLQLLTSPQRFAAMQKSDGKTLGCPALHYVAEHNLATICRFMLEKGKTTKSNLQVDSMDSQGRTALHRAAGCGHERVIRTLLEANADVNKQDSGRMTPLHWAICNRHERVVEMLLKANADVNKPDESGITPLRYAIFKGNERVVEMLLKANGDVNKPDESGITPLRYTIFKGNERVVEMLRKPHVGFNTQIKN